MSSRCPDRILKARAEAKSAGKKYYDGVPCKRGHAGLRYVSSSACVICERERMIEWRKENPTIVLETNLKYRTESRDKMLSYIRNWQQNNAEYKKQAKASWDAANRARKLVHDRTRRARKYGGGGKHTLEDVKDIKRLQRGKCAYCRAALSTIRPHVDHIIPLARGGGNERRNIQLLCSECNQSKHARDPIEFMRAQGALL